MKKSVSVPAELWAWVEEMAQASGHGMASRTIAEAVKHFRKAQIRKLREATR